MQPEQVLMTYALHMSGLVHSCYFQNIGIMSQNDGKNILSFATALCNNTACNFQKTSKRLNKVYFIVMPQFYKAFI